MDIQAFFAALEPATCLAYKDAIRSGYIEHQELDRAVAHSAAITAQKHTAALKDNTEALYAVGNICLELQTEWRNR